MTFPDKTRIKQLCGFRSKHEFWTCLTSYEDDEAEADEEAVDVACGWESIRSMSSSSLTPHVSTTQIRQLVTGNARTLLQVTHLIDARQQQTWERLHTVYF